MSASLQVTAGGSDPFVFTFWISAITTTLVLLGSIRVLQFPQIFVQWAMSLRNTQDQKPEVDFGLEWMERFVRVLVLFGMSVALPAIATQLFYVDRTAPYTTSIVNKTYRDVWWITTLWLYAGGAICIASGLTIEILPSLVAKSYQNYVTFSNYKDFIRIATYVIVILVLFTTVIFGLAVNAEEMGGTLGSPTPILFIINGILLVGYMIMEISKANNVSLRSIEAAKKIIQSSKKLTLLDIDDKTLNSSTMVHIRPSDTQSVVVAHNSDAHKAIHAAECLKKSSAENMKEFENGYKLRCVQLDGAEDVYMLDNAAAHVFDKLVKPASMALVHEKNYDEQESDVLQINTGVDLRYFNDKLGNATKRLQSIDLSVRSGSFELDASFLGMSSGMVYHVLIEEKSILLYIFYMLQIELFTLRCSPTAMLLWFVVHALPALYALSPVQYDISKNDLIDRRRQWAHVQMFFGCTALSLFGLIYKVFPVLPFNDYYVTAVDIWEFANNNGLDFWYTGIDSNIYANVEVVSILQITVFAYTAYLVVTFVLTGLSYCGYSCKIR